MKTADEMFEKLGYEKHINNNNIGYYQYDKDDNTILILFIVNKKAVSLRYDGSIAPAMNMQELQAINEKVKELRLEQLDNKINGG